jgi:hypothetical protein
MKEYEIWYDGVHPIRDHIIDNKVLIFETKKAANSWIRENVDESSQRRKYKVREAL